MTFLRAPIKLLISSDCFRVFDFSIWSSFSFFIFYFSKTSSYLLSKMSSTLLLLTFNLIRGSVYPGTSEEILTDCSPLTKKHRRNIRNQRWPYKDKIDVPPLRKSHSRPVFGINFDQCDEFRQNRTRLIFESRERSCCFRVQRLCQRESHFEHL